MIFLTVGTQKFQFNRLLQIVDNLINEKIITEKIVAQIGYSSYIPCNYEYYRFLNHNDYKTYIDECDLLITHGGVGSIIEGLKKNKKIIVFPRLKQFNEHVDDHQTEIAYKYKELEYTLCANDQISLIDAMKLSKTFISKYKFQSKNYIEEFIVKLLQK